MARAWCWEPACEHTLGAGVKEGGSRSSSPRQGQTRTQQAEKGALGEDG